MTTEIHTIAASMNVTQEDMDDQPRLRDLLVQLRRDLKETVDLDGGELGETVTVYVERDPASFAAPVAPYTITAEGRVTVAAPTDPAPPQCTFLLHGIAHPVHDRPAVHSYGPAGETVWWWCPGVHRPRSAPAA